MDERTMPEPVKVGGLFGKVMADISARAKEYREQGSIGMPRPESTKELSPQRVAEIHGLPQPKWGTTFDSFNVETAAIGRAKDAALALARGEWQPWCLVLSGNYGSGKTHLAYAVANYRRENGGSYHMMTAPALMAKLKNAIDEKKRSIDSMAALAYGPEEWVEVYSKANTLLILDDFGAHYDSEWAAAQMFAILNARYDAGLKTMLTTNLSAAQFDPRIASRIMRGIVVCNGADQRAKYG